MNLTNIDPIDPRDPRSTTQHPLGIRMDNVMHCCPLCNIGRPRSDCPVCYGAGAITEGQLALYADRHNAAMNTGTNPHRLPLPGDDH